MCGLPRKALGDGAPASRFLPSPQPASSAGGALLWQRTSTSVNDLKPHFSERRVKKCCTGSSWKLAGTEFLILSRTEIQPPNSTSGVLSMQRWRSGAALLLSNHWAGSCFTCGCHHVRWPSVIAPWLVDTVGNYSGMTSGKLESSCQTFLNMLSRNVIV